MRYIGRIACLALLAAAVPTGALAAPSARTTSVVLHVTSQFKSRAAFAHAMASAKLRFTKSDVYITLTADNLPSPATLGKRVYTLYASDGAMTEKVGVLHASGNMAGVSGELMMTRVHDLYVYAQSGPNVKRAGGVEILTAMV